MNNLVNFRLKQHTDWGDVYDVVYVNGVVCGEIYMEVDGFYVYDAPQRAGYLSQEFLEVVAEKLRVLNKPMKASYDEYFGE